MSEHGVFVTNKAGNLSQNMIFSLPLPTGFVPKPNHIISTVMLQDKMSNSHLKKCKVAYPGTLKLPLCYNILSWVVYLVAISVTLMWWTIKYSVSINCVM